MEKSPVERAIEGGLSLVSRIFPLQTYLYIPLLQAAFLWAARRRKEWKEKIFSWKVWLDPQRLQDKPDEFVLDFFTAAPALNMAYRAEIESRNLSALREAFVRLYPLLGLEEPFLVALFAEELKATKYRMIVREFEERVGRASRDIEAIRDKSRLTAGLEAFGKEMASLHLDLLSRSKVQKAIADFVRKRLEEKEEKNE